MGAWGALVAGWFLARPSSGGERDRLLNLSRRLGIFWGVALTVAMGLVFWRQLLEFRDPFAPWTEDADILLRQTDWGRTWIVATGAAVLTPLAFLVARDAGPRRAGWGAAALLVAGLCVFPAYTGHAAGVESLRWLAIPADAVHVLAAGSWIGGLLFVVLAEWIVRRAGAAAGASATVLPELVPRFSPIALTSVAALVVTGTIGAWLHIESPGLLLTSTYGRLLLAKLILVAAVLALGAINWRRLTPRLGEPEGVSALRRAATLELVLAHVVILVTALLVRTSPLHDWSWSNIGH